MASQKASTQQQSAAAKTATNTSSYVDAPLMNQYTAGGRYPGAYCAITALLMVLRALGLKYPGADAVALRARELEVPDARFTNQGSLKNVQAVRGFMFGWRRWTGFDGHSMPCFPGTVGPAGVLRQHLRGVGADLKIVDPLGKLDGFPDFSTMETVYVHSPFREPMASKCPSMVRKATLSKAATVDEEGIPARANGSIVRNSGMYSSRSPGSRLYRVISRKKMRTTLMMPVGTAMAYSSGVLRSTFSRCSSRPVRSGSGPGVKTSPVPRPPAPRRTGGSARGTPCSSDRTRDR